MAKVKVEDIDNELTKNFIDEVIHHSYGHVKYNGAIEAVETPNGTGYIIKDSTGMGAIYVPPNLSDCDSMLVAYPGMGKTEESSTPGLTTYGDVLSKIQTGESGLGDSLVVISPNWGLDGYVVQDLPKCFVDLSLENDIDIKNLGIVTFSDSGTNGFLGAAMVSEDNPEIEIRIGNIDTYIGRYYPNDPKTYKKYKDILIQNEVLIISLHPSETDGSGSLRGGRFPQDYKFLRALNKTGHNAILVTSSSTDHGYYIQQFKKAGGLEYLVGKGDFDYASFANANVCKFDENGNYVQLDPEEVFTSFTIKSNNPYIQKSMTVLNAFANTSLLTAMLQSGQSSSTTKTPSKEPGYVTKAMTAGKTLCEKISVEAAQIGAVGDRFKDMDRDLAIKASDLNFDYDYQKAHIESIKPNMDEPYALTPYEMDKVRSEFELEEKSKDNSSRLLGETVVYDRDTNSLQTIYTAPNGFVNESLRAGSIGRPYDDSKVYIIDGHEAVGDAARDIVNNTVPYEPYNKQTVVSPEELVAGATMIGMGATGAATTPRRNGGTFLGDTLDSIHESIDESKDTPTAETEPRETVDIGDRGSHALSGPENFGFGSRDKKPTVKKEDTVKEPEIKNEEVKEPEVKPSEGSRPSNGGTFLGDSVSNIHETIEEAKENHVDIEAEPKEPVDIGDRASHALSGPEDFGFGSKDKKPKKTEDVVVTPEEVEEPSKEEEPKLPEATPTPIPEPEEEDTVVVPDEEEKPPRKPSPYVPPVEKPQEEVVPSEPEPTPEPEVPEEEPEDIVVPSVPEEPEIPEEVEPVIEPEKPVEEPAVVPVIDKPTEAPKPVKKPSTIKDITDKELDIKEPSIKLPFEEDRVEPEVIVPSVEKDDFEEEVPKTITRLDDSTDELSDALKVAGLTAAAGAAVGAAAYGINSYMNNKTPGDDHYKYEKDDDEDESDFDEIETDSDSLNDYDN